MCRQSASKSHNGEAIVKILEEMDTNVVYLLQFSKTVALTDLKHEATEVNVSNYIFMHTPEFYIFIKSNLTALSCFQRQ